MFWLLLLVASAIFLYFTLIKHFKYWSEKNVPQLSPMTLLKQICATIRQSRTPAEAFLEMYNSFPNLRYAGLYQLHKPILILRDPELIKLITVKDFDHFADHGFVLQKDSEPLWEKNLIALKGEQWRDMRSTLSPSFTSSKMKMMFGLICECAEQFVKYFEEGNSETRTLEFKDAFTRFTNDVIASIAFGVRCDSLKDRDNEFYTMGKNATNWGTLKFILLFVAPRLSGLLGLKLFSTEVSSFFRRLVKDNMESREREGIVRPDMMQLLMEARKGRTKQKGVTTEIPDAGFAVIEETFVGKQEKTQKGTLTDDDITAQAMIFFLAGFDSVSSEMCFMAYELALNPDVQERLQNEVDDTLNDCGGSVTYDALVKMKYMDMVISETLRKWPTTIAADRLCLKPYTIQPVKEGETAVHLKKGDILMIPIFGIHRDPEFYPNPERFDPDRFSEANKSNIKPYSYLVFGSGPRSCIGNRFALLEMKVVFFYLLSKFNITVVEKSTVPLKIGKNPVTLSSENGFWLGLKSRKTVL